MFRKKSRTEVIGAELQEGFAHIGAAVTEARKATAEQLRPQVEAATKAAQLAYAADVAPRPSAVRAADRRAHLLEQEVTLAYLRELAGPNAFPGRRAA